MMTYLISLAPSRLVQLSPKQQNRIDKIPSPILLEASGGQNRLFHRLLTVGGAPMEAPVPHPPFQKAMTFQFYFMYWYYCNHKLTCSRTDKACASKTGTENLVRKPKSVYWQSVIWVQWVLHKKSTYKVGYELYFTYLKHIDQIYWLFMGFWVVFFFTFSGEIVSFKVTPVF